MSQSQTTATAIQTVLAEAMESNPSVVVLGESVGRMGGVAGTSAGLLQAHGPDRVWDTPIADRGTLGVALGMALGGRIAVVELADSGRLADAQGVLAAAGAIASRGDFAVPLIVRVPYGTEAIGVDTPVGRTLGGLPGVHIVCASDAHTAAGLLRTALSGRHPTVILEPRSIYGERSAVNGESVPFKARALRTGAHVTLAAWGAGVHAAAAAAEALAQEGLDAEVLDLVSVSPIDIDSLGASVRKTGRLVVVHPSDSATADAARAIGLDQAFLYLESPLATAPESAGAVAEVARNTIHY